MIIGGILLLSLIGLHAIVWTAAHFLILPAQIYQTKFNNRDLKTKKLKIQTPASTIQTEVCLNATQYTENDSIEDIINDKKVIIGFNPNAGVLDFDSIPYFGIDPSKAIKVHFQYPGIDESTGLFVDQEDLINAGVSVIDYFLDHGVQPKDIIFYGWSLGGSIATLSLDKLLQRNTSYKAITLINDRSFSSVSKVIDPLDRLKALLIFFNLNFDAGTCWQNRLKDVSKKCLYTSKDKVIPPKASIKTAATTHEIKELRFAIDGDCNHNQPLSWACNHLGLKDPITLTTLFPNKYLK
jgi:hypothetical protein